MRNRAERMLETALALARSSSDPFDLAYALCSLGAVRYEEARWVEANQHLEQGLEIMRERCAGRVWEKVTAEAFNLSALAHRGELRVLSRRLPAAIGSADERRDLYAAIGFRAGILNLVWLAQDDPEAARNYANEPFERWPMKDAATFHIQHYLHLIAMVHIELYVGDVWGAWRRILDAWPRIKRAQLLRMQSPSVELWNLRARVALAVAGRGGAGDSFPGSRRDRAWTRRDLLEIARRDAYNLSRRSIASARPLATLLRAGIAGVTGRMEEAAQTYRDAAAALELVGMRLYASVARLRQGALLGGDEGSALSTASLEWLRGQEVQNSEHLAAVCAPGTSTAVR